MPQPPAVNPILQMFPLIFIFIIFYFLLIRPQKKQERQRQEMLKNIAKNDEVITTGGIHGTIVNIKDKTVVLRVDENTRIEVERSCIGQVKKGQP
jgi:preprotein translocase subunit YajC